MSSSLLRGPRTGLCGSGLSILIPKRQAYLYPLLNVALTFQQKVGHSVRGRSKARPSLESTHDISFRKPPQNQDYKPMFQAPIGSRGIFAEVRAQTPARTQNTVVPYPPTMQGGSFPDLTSSVATAVPVHVGDTPITRGGTMSRGNTSGKSYVKKMDPLIWLNSVKVDGSRARSSSGPESAEVSRVRDDEEVFVGRKRRSESREERRETEDGSGGQSLHQEFVLSVWCCMTCTDISSPGSLA